MTTEHGKRNAWKPKGMTSDTTYTCKIPATLLYQCAASCQYNYLFLTIPLLPFSVKYADFYSHIQQDPFDRPANHKAFTHKDHQRKIWIHTYSKPVNPVMQQSYTIHFRPSMHLNWTTLISWWETEEINDLTIPYLCWF
jgi:hypothetical protein